MVVCRFVLVRIPYHDHTSLCTDDVMDKLIASKNANAALTNLRQIVLATFGNPKPKRTCYVCFGFSFTADICAGATQAVAP